MTIIVECHYTHLLKLQLLLLVFCKTAFMPLKSPFHSVSFQSHVCQLRNRENAEASYTCALIQKAAVYAVCTTTGRNVQPVKTHTRIYSLKMCVVISLQINIVQYL